MRRIRRRWGVLVVALVTAGCGGSDAATGTAPPAVDTVASATTAAPSTAGPATVPATTEPATSMPTTSAPATTAPAPTTTAPADVLQRQAGVLPVAVTVAGTDPTRPTFVWDAVAGATSYELVVHAGDGTPSWAWTGDATTVPLGGVERGADQEGPTLAGPSTVRVYAFDANAHLVAVSPWTPVPI